MGDLLVPQTESEILEILRVKHSGDLFVAHCKTGPSTMAYGEGNGPLTLDAWVMPYSWTKPIVGYEVKTSRSDFWRDRKWRGYLQYCNVFFFVVPHGLIEPTEIPAEAGLIWTTMTGRGIRHKKPAPLRCWHQIPQAVFQYVLMWRREAFSGVPNDE